MPILRSSNSERYLTLFSVLHETFSFIVWFDEVECCWREGFKSCHVKGFTRWNVAIVGLLACMTQCNLPMLEACTVRDCIMYQAHVGSCNSPLESCLVKIFVMLGRTNWRNRHLVCVKLSIIMVWGAGCRSTPTKLSRKEFNPTQQCVSLCPAFSRSLFSRQHFLLTLWLRKYQNELTSPV